MKESKIMKEITVTTQQEFDALPPKFEEFTYIYIKNIPANGRIYVSIHRDNSSVVARVNSSVEAWGNSSVVARDNSSVVARDNSSVVARDNSSVVAWDNSSVEAWDNSSVEARGNSSVRLRSIYASVILFAFSACWVLAEGKVEKKAETATIIKPIVKEGTDGWLEANALLEKESKVIPKAMICSKEPRKHHPKCPTYPGAQLAIDEICCDCIYGYLEDKK